jgi:hypothetical protein
MSTKYIIIILVMLGLTGCQEKKKTDYVSDSLKEVVVPQKAHTRQASTQTKPTPRTVTSINSPISVPPIGIKVDQNQIIIDTNQTKKFLESLTKKIDQSFKKVASNLKRNKIKTPNETGIIITQDRIEVDLNKTQKFMEKWIRSMETVGKQLDNIAKELDKTFKP